MPRFYAFQLDGDFFAGRDVGTQINVPEGAAPDFPSEPVLVSNAELHSPACRGSGKRNTKERYGSATATDSIVGRDGTRARTAAGYADTHRERERKGPQTRFRGPAEPPYLIVPPLADLRALFPLLLSLHVEHSQLLRDADGDRTNGGVAVAAIVVLLLVLVFVLHHFLILDDDVAVVFLVFV